MTYPANADMVVVQHSWWNDATRRGVDAQVTWTPLPFTGAAAPNLVDSSARGWIKLQPWTSKPEPVTGYMAVPLTASNDPDLQAFPGYRVTAGQEPPFTIAVDVAAPFVAADQRMVDALAALTPPVTLTVGAQIRTVWLTDVAVVSPSPTSPPAFLTATQTESYVLDAVAAHDTDPQAHPDIRALITGGDVSTRLVITRTAALPLSGHRVVAPTSSGALMYADNQTAAHAGSPLWVTTGATASGAAATVVTAGPVTEPSWSWTVGAPVFLGANGMLTQTRPVAPAVFLVQVGYASGPNTLHVDRSPSIQLA